MANSNTIEGNPHDGLILELAKAGDEMAIDQLARAYWPEAYRAAVRIVRSHEDAEEIAQDSLWAAIRHLPTFREDSSFRSWLFRIVFNHSMMAIRRKRARRLDAASPFTDDAAMARLRGPRTPEQILLEAECRTVIEEGMSQLPATYATVLQLVAREDPSMSDIAKRVGISTGAAKTRLHRGRLELRREIRHRLSVSGGSRKYGAEAASMVAA